MSDDYDVPPLEDCSEYFTMPTSPPSSIPTHDLASSVEVPTPTAQSNNSFAGMKKGFLNKGKTSKKKPADDIPFIKPSKSASNTSNLQIPEVQEALKTPLLGSNDWITDDLLHKIESNPKLARHLANPRMAEALHKFQTDQATAMKQYQSDAEVQEFFHEFCSVMGDHFTKLADTTKPKSKAAPAHAEDKRVEELLSNEDVQSAMLDSYVQNFISLLKKDPEKAHRLLSKATPEFRQKVNLLVSKGILAVQ